jgi:hypothetical protein
MDLITFPEDMTEEEKTMLMEFKQSGCPGVGSIDEQLVFQFCELYMSGKTYGEIAQFTKQKKPLVLYMSSYGKWHEKRMKHFQSISETMLSKVHQARLNGINSLTTLINAYTQMIDAKSSESIAKNDPKILESLQRKEVAHYYKAMELLNKLMLEVGAKSVSAKGNNVNINVGNNATITQTDPNTIEVSANDSSAKILEELVKNKRARR